MDMDTLFCLTGASAHSGLRHSTAALHGLLIGETAHNFLTNSLEFTDNIDISQHNRAYDTINITLLVRLQIRFKYFHTILW